jgi:hypothetical protein
MQTDEMMIVGSSARWYPHATEVGSVLIWKISPLDDSDSHVVDVSGGGTGIESTVTRPPERECVPRGVGVVCQVLQWKDSAVSLWERPRRCAASEMI